MDLKVMTSPKEIANLYSKQSLVNCPSRAYVGPLETTEWGVKYSNISIEWTGRDVYHNGVNKDFGQSILFYEPSIHFGPFDFGSLSKEELESQYSPFGERKATVNKCSIKGEVFLEVLKTKNGFRINSFDLPPLIKHGNVYEDEQFDCLVWSHSETHLLYVAEMERPKAESYFQRNQFVHYEDWGEDLLNKSSPVIYILDIEGDNLSVLKGVPEDIFPGQAIWAPNDTGVVFVGWWYEPFRLGLNYCPNRQSSLFYVDFADGKCEQLTDSTAVMSPRLSPDHCRIAYLECDVYGPHQQCNKLCLYDWNTKKASVVVDVVKRAREDGFTGIYSSMLSHQCWSDDSQRVLITSAQRSRKDILVANTSTGEVTSLTSKSDMGSWCLLTIRRDLMLVSYSSPNCRPHVRKGVLPASGSEDQVSWIKRQNTWIEPEIDWQVVRFTPPPEEDNKQYPGLDFDGILIKPKNVAAGTKLPLIVKPHGGPHSVIVTEWLLRSAVLCKMGFGVLHVNYRGSIGYGQDSIYSLSGNVGTQDVKDVQFAVETILKRDDFDREKVAVVGESHGGFLACHLIGQYPDFYKACAVLNPITNLASRICSPDIPDWCTVKAGFDLNINTTMLEQMINKSPIKHVTQVKTPVLLTLGAEDKRVPIEQVIDYYKVLKSLQVPVRLLRYPEDVSESEEFLNIALWIIQHLKL